MTEGNGVLQTATIAVEDWADPDVRELTVWFKDGNDFAAVFSNHPDYRAYYSQSGNDG